LFNEVISIRAPDMLMGIEIGSGLKSFFNEILDKRQQVGLDGANVRDGAPRLSK